MRLSAFGILLFLLISAGWSAEASSGNNNSRPAPPSAADIALLNDFWKALDAPENTEQLDLLRTAYQFGKKRNAEFLNVVLADLADDKSPFLSNDRGGSFWRDERYQSLVYALIYGPQEKRALEIAGWWREHGNSFQQNYAKGWIKTHDEMRLVEHGEEYRLKDRVWPSLAVQARQQNVSVQRVLGEYSQLFSYYRKTRIPRKRDFQGAQCQVYRIGPHDYGDGAPSIEDWRIVAGPVAAPKRAAATIAKRICDPAHISTPSMCGIDAGLALRFKRKGKAPIDLCVCFHCGDMVLTRGKEIGIFAFSPTLRRDFLKLGRRVAPHDEIWNQIETELNE